MSDDPKRVLAPPVEEEDAKCEEEQQSAQAAQPSPRSAPQPPQRRRSAEIPLEDMAEAATTPNQGQGQGHTPGTTSPQPGTSGGGGGSTGVRRRKVIRRYSYCLLLAFLVVFLLPNPVNDLFQTFSVVLIVFEPGESSIVILVLLVLVRHGGDRVRDGRAAHLRAVVPFATARCPGQTCARLSLLHPVRLFQQVSITDSQQIFLEHEWPRGFGTRLH